MIVYVPKYYTRELNLNSFILDYVIYSRKEILKSINNK